jgi:DNA-binding SARP family transcriptional activator
MTVMPVRAHVVDPAPDGATSIHLLGGPYVVEAGRMIPVPDGSKRLLVYIALHAGRVDRHHVAGTLWPFGDEERAAGNLRSALWRLKSAGTDVIEVDKCTLGMRAGTVLDLDVVRAWASRVITGTVDDDLHLPSWTPDEVELLPGWYEDWVIFERERTRQRVLHAMEGLSRRLLIENRSAEAVEAALFAVRIDPLRETAQAALIEAHLSEGNTVEAHHAFATYSELLRCELDIAPGPEITALVHGRSGAGMRLRDVQMRTVSRS